MATTEPGVHFLTLARNHARDLNYTLAIPNGFTTQSDPLPLIVALHFSGHGQPHFGASVLTELVGPALHELGAIIAAPDCPAEVWASAGGERAVLDLLDSLLKDYPIQPRRVVLSGYSMGGMGVWYMAARQPDRFSAAIPVSGMPPSDLDPAAWKVPLLAIHSTDDELMPVGPTGLMIDRLRDAGARAGLLLTQGISHFETARFIPHLRTAVAWIRRVWELGEKS